MNTMSRPVSGFTLLELLIVLAILGILVVIGTPAMDSLIESSRSKAVRQQLQVLLNEARSAALSNSEIITICSLDSGSGCGQEFQLPLTMFADTNRNAELDAGERILTQLNIELPDDHELDWNRQRYIRFWPSGGTGALTGSITYCHAYQEKYEFRIVIARTGRTRVDFDETRCM